MPWRTCISCSKYLLILSERLDAHCFQDIQKPMNMIQIVQEMECTRNHDVFLKQTETKFFIFCLIFLFRHSRMCWISLWDLIWVGQHVGSDEGFSMRSFKEIGPSGPLVSWENKLMYIRYSVEAFSFYFFTVFLHVFFYCFKETKTMTNF